MTVTFAEKLARMPGYQAGVPTGQAPEAIVAAEIAQLASNESPFPPHPKVIEAIQAGAAAMHRYPDPRRRCCAGGSPSAMRPSPAGSPSATVPARSCCAAAEALCEPRR